MIVHFFKTGFSLLKSLFKFALKINFIYYKKDRYTAGCGVMVNMRALGARDSRFESGQPD